MNVADLLESFRSKRVLVIGDTIIDIATHCDAIGISAETPTMVLRKKPYDERRMQYDEVTYGGAALVVRNLLELGASVDFLTFAGSGAWETDLERWKHPNLKNNLVYAQTALKKPVTVKHRFWAGDYKILQVNTEEDKLIDSETERHAIMQYNLLTGVFSKTHDAIVIADYRQGFITPIMASRFSANTTKTPIYISSQTGRRESNHHWYAGGSAKFVGNEKEGASSKELATTIVMTMGDKGSRIYPLPTYTPAIAITPIDVCGAGDAFLAAYSLTNDLKFSNLWAGLSCLVKGANPPTKKMLLDWEAAHGKIAA